MSTIKMKMDEYSPQVSFDKHSSRLNISGRSVQENPEPWYAELLEKILEEISNNNISSIRFLLDYFNTASAKQEKIFRECLKRHFNLKKRSEQVSGVRT
jgi:hypothetical protein